MQTRRILRFSRSDWLQLLGFWLLGSGLCFLVLFPLLRALMHRSLVEAVTERIEARVILSEALLADQPPKRLPGGLDWVPNAAGRLQVVSAPLRTALDFAVQRDLREHHGLDRRLVKATADAQGGYWVELCSQPPLWLRVPSPYGALPVFWPLVRTLTVAGGGLLGLVLFLRLRVKRPLMRLVAGLRVPSPHGDLLPLVPERGVAPVQELARRINRLIEQHNQNAAERTQLLRGLVHDIRSPLTRLLLRWDQVRACPDPARLRQELPAINADFDQLSGLADQLAALANQDDPGRQVQSLALDGLCARVAQSYPAGAVELAVPRLLVRLDAALLQRSLTNLIDNALEYGRPPVRITARLRRRGLGLELWVDDHGDGLETYDGLPGIGLPRFDDRQRQRHSGMGLAIVQRFCRDHGGELRLQPAPSGGLRVCLRLPPAVLIASPAP